MRLPGRPMKTYEGKRNMDGLVVTVDGQRLDEHYAVTSIPTTMVLDRQGNISFRQAGFNSREDFVAMLAEKIEAARK